MKFEKKYLLAGGLLAFFLIVIAYVIFISSPSMPVSNELSNPAKISDTGPSSLDGEVSSTSPEVESVKNTVAQSADEGLNFWLVTLLPILLISLGVNFLTFFRVNQNQKLIPSVFGKSQSDSSSIHNLLPAFNKISTLPELIVKASQRSDERFSQLENKLADVTEMVGIFKESVDKKDKEIERFKKGYDYVVFKRFVSRYLRFHRQLASMALEAQDNQDLKDALVLLEDAIFESGVEKYVPAIGSSLDETEGLDTPPKMVQVTKGSEPYLIVEVLEPGFRVELPDGYDYLRKAKVAISAPL